MKKTFDARYTLDSLDGSPFDGARKNALYNIAATVAECFGIDLDPEDPDTQDAAEILLSRLGDGFDAAGGLYDPSDLPELDLYVTWRVQYTNLDTGRTGCTFFESKTPEEARRDFAECFRHHAYRVDSVEIA